MRVIDLLENGIKRFPNRTCVVDEDISLTHAQALQMSHQIANGLSSRASNADPELPFTVLIQHYP